MPTKLVVTLMLAAGGAAPVAGGAASAAGAPAGEGAAVSEEAVSPVPTAPAASRPPSGYPSTASPAPIPTYLPGEFEVEQNNWDGGPGRKGPVTEFLNEFHTAQSMNYGETGQLRLSGEGRRFLQKYPFTLPGVDGTLSDFDLAPVNNDNDDDIVASLDVTGETRYRIGMWENQCGTPPAFLPPETVFETGSEPLAPRAVKIGNVAGNSYEDVVALCRGRVVICEQTAPGSWASLMPNLSPIHPVMMGDICLVDVNDDTKLDMAFAISKGYSDGGVLVLYNYSRTTSREAFLATGASFTGLATADFDRDGDADFVATGHAGTVFFETDAGPNPTWSAVQRFNYSGARVAAGDFNRDGWADAVVAGEGFNTRKSVGVYINRGTKPASFNHYDITPSAGPTGGDFTDVAAADLDGDNFADLAVSMANPHAVFIRYNDGKIPTSANWEEIGGGAFCTRLAAGDLDCDGSMDLVGAAPQGNFNWFRFGGGTAPSGNLVSSIYDTGGTDTLYEKVTWNAAANDGTVQFKARTSPTANMSGALSWGNCTPLTKGAPPGRENGVFDRDRYLQYRVELTSQGDKSPVVNYLRFHLSGGDDDGPVTSGVQVWPNPVEEASEILIQGLVSDASTGNSNIRAAEFFLDDPPGEAGTGTPLDPTDGKWDSPLEAVELRVATVGFGETEVHTLRMRGKDSRENWGALVTYRFETGDSTFFPKELCYAYPNPVYGDAEFAIAYFVRKNATVKLEIYDLRGRRVATAEGEGFGYQSNYVLVDVSHLAPDIYFYKATATSHAAGETATVVKKFAVIK